jgi:hypothetical protein
VYRRISSSSGGRAHAHARHEAAAAVLVREYEQALLQEGRSILEIDETGQYRAVLARGNLDGEMPHVIEHIPHGAVCAKH